MSLELSKFEEEVPAIIRQANELVVTDAEGYERAGQQVVQIKGKIKAFKEWMKPHKEAADRVHAGLCAEENRIVGLYQKVLDIISPKAMSWKKQQDDIRAEQERKLREEEQKLAEDRALAEAAAAEKAGDHETANQILEEPIKTPHVTLRSAVPKVAGLGSKKKWKFRMLDPKKVNRAHCKPDESIIRQTVEREGKEAERLVGAGSIFAYEDESFVGTGRR